MGVTIDILNSIRNNGTAEFKARIPEATQGNLSEWGAAMKYYDTLWNEFHSSLMNKIGKTIILDKMFTNRLARFKKGLVSPHDIEEIYVGLAKAEGAYDPQGSNPLGRREGPEVNVAYHRETRRDKYVVSIGDIDFARVFTNEATVEAFIKEKLNSIYSGDAYDEWLAIKKLIAQCGTTGNTYQTAKFGSGTSPEEINFIAKMFVKTLRKAVQDMCYPSTTNNKAGVLTWCESPADLVLFINKDVLVEVDVDLIASAFHDSATNLKVVPTIIPLDGLSGEESPANANPLAILADKEWLKIYDTKFHMETQRNADGLFTNYFLHHHQILSTSPFCNVAAIVDTDIAVSADA